MYFAIKVGSITNAQRAVRVLKNNGYKPRLSRIENPRPNEGCGYVIRVEANSQNDVTKILQNSKITVFGVEEL
jgi:hypothetical protein